MLKMLTPAIATVLVMSTLITPVFADVTVPGSGSSDGGSATVPSASSSDGGASAATVPNSGNANGGSASVPGSSSSNGGSSSASVPTSDSSNGGSSAATVPSSESSNGGANSATVPASGSTNGGSGGAVTPVAGTTNGGSGAGGGLTFIPEAPVRNSGGGGGGGGNGPVSGTNFSAATSATSTNSIRPCAPLLTVYFSPLISNTAADILKLQAFLKDTAKFNVVPTGIYDTQTISAVAAFQVKYANEVLTPWGVTNPSGNVYISTRKKINSIACNNAPITYTADELATFQGFKVQRTNPTLNTPVTSATPSVPTTGVSPVSATTSTPATTNEPIFGTNTATNNTASVLNAISDRVNGFFSRIYHFFVK